MVTTRPPYRSTLASMVARTCLAAVAIFLVAASAASAAPFTFEYTGAAQTWTVPTGVTSATFDIYGAAGYGPQPPQFRGGKGGRATATLSVTPGQVLEINVGGAGIAGVNGGGFNGGGGGFYGGGGGGGTDVRIGGTALTDRALVAGGGGAGGGCSAGPATVGGDGGGLVGGDGFNGGCQSIYVPGTGGTQVAGGSVGGTAGQGGSSGFGGGGGYFGGGGGPTSAGGGGSGYGPSGVIFETGVRDGNGLVTITPFYDLGISLSGTGTGRVTSSPAGIDCQSGSGSGCSARFPSGQITLSASAASGSAFTGWDGAGCSGTSDCIVTLDAAKTVNATFAADPPPAASPPTAAGAGLAAPAISGLSVDRRCVRAATLSGISTLDSGLSFRFALSEDATVRYEIVRRTDSPKRTRCPKPGGAAPLSFSNIWNQSDQESSGERQTSLATTSSRRALRGRTALRAGKRRLTLGRLANGRNLTWGSYLLHVTASNAAGTSRTATIQFWVLRPRR